ncbi:MAG: hypothetical protein V1930_03275 [Pseudomonadota bacterium]
MCIRDLKPFLGPLLLVDLFLLGNLILATRMATFLHEVLGHGLMAVALGGRVDGIQVSLFGGGHAQYLLEADSGLSVRFLAALGGILINGISGTLSLLFVRKLGRRPERAVFFALFGMVSLLGAIAYAAMGFYYGQGDPAAWAGGSLKHSGSWVPFILVSPFASYAAVRSYATTMGAWFPSRTFLARCFMVFLTLCITGCAYAGLYRWTAQRSVALDAPSRAYEEAEEEIRTVKRDELYRRIRETHPELTEEEVRLWVEKTPIPVHPDEVPHKFPLKPVIAFLYGAGGLFALLGWKGASLEPSGRISKRSVVLMVMVAGAILGLLAWTGGWIWPMPILWA